MHAFGIVGPDDDRDAAADRLIERLSEHGRVGVVTGGVEARSTAAPGASAQYRDAGASIAAAIGEGHSVTTEPPRSLDEALDDLTPECDYAVVVGRPDADLPQVVIGDRDVAGRVLVRVPEAAAIDPAEIVGLVEDLEPRATLESLVTRAKRSEDEVFSGAIATFTGRVRAREGPDDDYTEQLEFEKYDGVAEERMAAIRDDLESRDGVFDVLLHHKTGVVEAGEDIVFVVVLAGHRSEAFRTVEDGINRLKDEVPLFKKEVTVEEEFWAHESDRD